MLYCSQSEYHHCLWTMWGNEFTTVSQSVSTRNIVLVRFEAEVGGIQRLCGELKVSSPISCVGSSGLDPLSSVMPQQPSSLCFPLSFTGLTCTLYISALSLSLLHLSFCLHCLHSLIRVLPLIVWRHGGLQGLMPD